MVRLSIGTTKTFKTPWIGKGNTDKKWEDMEKSDASDIETSAEESMPFFMRELQ